MKRIIAYALALLVALALASVWLKSCASERLLLRLRMIPEAERRSGRSLAGAGASDAKAAAADYVHVLVLGGNLGRALLVDKAYGVGSQELAEVVSAIKLIEAELRTKGVFPRAKLCDLAAEYRGYPLADVLYFYRAYREVVLGDWKSAANDFKKMRRLPGDLDLYRRYYLARTMYLSGYSQDGARELESLRKDFARRFGASPKRGAGGLAGDPLHELYFKVCATLDWPLAYPPEGRPDLVGPFISASEWIPFATRALNADAQSRDADGAAAMMNELARAVSDSDDISPALSKAVTEAVAALGFKVVAPRLVGDAYTLVVRSMKMQAKAADARAFISAAYATNKASVKQWPILKSQAYLLYAQGNAAGLQAIASKVSTGAAGLPRDDSARSSVFAALVWYGELLEESHNWQAARRIYILAEQVYPRHANKARYRRYLIDKPTADLATLASGLRKIAATQDDDPVGVEGTAGVYEDLLPLLYLTSRKDAVRALEDARRYAHRYAAEPLFAYWANRLGVTTPAQPGGNPFSLYSLLLSRDLNINPTGSPLALEDQHPVEYLLGLGLRDMFSLPDAGDSGVTGGIQPVIGAFIAASDAYVPRQTASVIATDILDRYDLSDPVVRRVAALVAFPTPHLDDVMRAAEKYGVSASLTYAVMKQESSFREGAVSSTQDLGLMQVRPDTIRWIIDNLRVPVTYADRFKPSENIALGAAYLKFLEGRVGASTTMVAAAYNAGWAKAIAWRRRFGGADEDAFSLAIPNGITAQYVKRVRRNEMVYRIILTRD
jgi:hypothetical protein